MFIIRISDYSLLSYNEPHYKRQQNWLPKAVLGLFLEFIKKLLNGDVKYLCIYKLLNRV